MNAYSATDTAALQTYVDHVLRAELRPGDVVVFDTLKPHLAAGVAASIEGTGERVLLLPAYSSDYNPIEDLWSHFKGRLRRAAARTRESLYKAIGSALEGVTHRQILGWLNHSGLYAIHS